MSDSVARGYYRAIAPIGVTNPVKYKSSHRQPHYLSAACSSVFTPSASSTLDALCVFRATYHMVPHAWQIANSPAANQHHRVFSQIVSLTRNIRRHFGVVRQSDAGDFPKRGVRLPRRHHPHLQAYAALLRCTAPQRPGACSECIVHCRQCWRLALTLRACALPRLPD